MTCYSLTDKEVEKNLMQRRILDATTGILLGNSYTSNNRMSQQRSICGGSDGDVAYKMYTIVYDYCNL